MKSGNPCFYTLWPHPTSPFILQTNLKCFHSLFQLLHLFHSVVDPLLDFSLGGAQALLWTIINKKFMTMSCSHKGMFELQHPSTTQQLPRPLFILYVTLCVLDRNHLHYFEARLFIFSHRDSNLVGLFAKTLLHSFTKKPNKLLRNTACVCRTMPGFSLLLIMKPLFHKNFRSNLYFLSGWRSLAGHVCFREVGYF